MIMELDHSPITEYFAIRVSFILLLLIHAAPMINSVNLFSDHICTHLAIQPTAIHEYICHN